MSADQAAVVATIRGNDRFVVVTHENPDGDALGSMLATTLGLRALGKDASMYLTGTAPLPAEYAFLELDGLSRTLPDDLGERVLRRRRLRQRAPDRRGRDRRRGRAARRQRRPPPRQRPLRRRRADRRPTPRRRPRSSATSCAELDVALTPEIAQALYVGLVTDTGRFQYSNTTPKALALAAELVAAGADVHGVFQHVYETVQFAKLKLLARALERAQLYEGGRLVVSYLLKDDFGEVGAEEPYSEGIIDHLRVGRGLGDGRADPRAAAQRRPGAADLAALEPRRGRRLGDRTQRRAAAGTARRLVSRPRRRSTRSSSSCAASYVQATRAA